MTVPKVQNRITRTEQKKLTRQKIIDATFDVIAKEGFSGVTMAKVAETAGLSRGIGNFHFQSMEQFDKLGFEVVPVEFAAFAGNSSCYPAGI